MESCPASHPPENTVLALPQILSVTPDLLPSTETSQHPVPVKPNWSMHFVSIWGRRQQPHVPTFRSHRMPHMCSFQRYMHNGSLHPGLLLRTRRCSHHLHNGGIPNRLQIWRRAQTGTRKGAATSRINLQPPIAVSQRAHHGSSVGSNQPAGHSRFQVTPRF
jgi:hypothetical protein